MTQAFETDKGTFIAEKEIKPVEYGTWYIFEFDPGLRSPLKFIKDAFVLEDMDGNWIAISWTGKMPKRISGKIVSLEK